MIRGFSRAARAAATSVSLCVAALGCNSHPVAVEKRPAATRAAAAAAPAAVAATTTQSEEADAKKTLYFLASDDLEGRGVGTAGLDRAADFIADGFRKFGLKPLPGMKDCFQSFEMTTTTQVGPNTSLAVGERMFTAKEDFSPLSFSGEGSFKGPVVFIGYAIKDEKHKYDDFAGVDLKDKVALAMRYEPHDAKGNSRFEKDGWSENAALWSKAKAAKDAGAIALLLVTPETYHGGDDQLVPFARRPMGDASKLPVMHVRHTVADELLRRGGAPDLKTLQAKIDENVKPASFPLADVEVSGQVDLERKKAAVKNVVAYLPGEKRDEYVIIGAHYDHLGRGGIGSLSPNSKDIHNGADDNASGTTVMLELAARFARGPTPQRSIIFLAFTAEEEGLLGSQKFIEQCPVPRSQIVAMLNLDMVGRIRSTPSSVNIAAPPSSNKMREEAATAPSEAGGILYIGGSGTAKDFQHMIEQADKRSPLVVRDIGKGGLGPSDHMSFALKKIPVMFFFSGLHADYHRPTDDADKINYDGLEQVIGFVEDVAKQVIAMPREEYVSSADASSPRVGSPSGTGTSVTLGVVPDYSNFGEGGGVRISGTSPDSPAAKAGLREGDIIVKWNDGKIDTLYDLSDMLAKGKPGDKVKLGVMRDKQPIVIEATLIKRQG
jgi:hypothetical protein